MYRAAHCPNPSCPNAYDPPPRWICRYGFYDSTAHGHVQRYRCRACHHTFSDQSLSLHYFAKRRLPLFAMWCSLLEGASLREIARRYHTSPPSVQTALLRLGRQAMAAQLHLLSGLSPRSCVVYDGLRSCLSSQDYPCDITTVVDPNGETILTMSHTVMRRGGTMTPAQRRRSQRKERVWRPKKGTMSRDISLLQQEIWSYLRPNDDEHPAAVIDTDEHPLYRSRLLSDPIAEHLRQCGHLEHRRTPGSAPRTIANRLFAVNYIDRLLRHRLKEHTRESIAIGRNATMQMHRAWIFAFDHNCLREYRVKHPQLGRHSEQGAIGSELTRCLATGFFRQRIEVRGLEVPETIRRVWMGKLEGPPIRWKVGQKGSSVKIPRYALRDLGAFHQQAA
jgi:transposase-like protein